MLGPGKYGANAEALLRKHGGDLCLIVMLGGPHGPSFDVATSDPTLLAALPAVLRRAADEIGGELRGDLTAAILEQATRGEPTS